MALVDFEIKRAPIIAREDEDGIESEDDVDDAEDELDKDAEAEEEDDFGDGKANY